MSSRSLALVSSIMSNIDEVKDKLNDGEYLTLCNLLKSLNEEIKTPSRYEEDEQDENLNIAFLTTRSLSERVYNFFHNPNFYTREGETNPRISFNEVLELFKNFLLEIHETEEENENTNRWFICACGCSVYFHDIPEHLETSNHRENFNIEI